MHRFHLLLWMFFCFLILEAQSQASLYQFGRIDISKGLSHQAVNDIYKDSTGYVWFATASGLNRYDGYSIKVFRNIPGDSTSIATNEVNQLYEGPFGMLWIYAHPSGNNVYNPRTETFHRNTNALLANMNIPGGVIKYIKKDKLGNFWFIHYNQGLFCFNPITKKTTRLIPSNDPGSISSLQMAAVEEDRQGNIWLIHQNGIFEMIDHESMLVTYRNVELRDRFNAQLFEYIIMVDADDDVWIAPDRNFGCFLFETKKKILTNLNRESKAKLTSNIVKRIVQDDKGIIWIGTENGGLNLINKNDFTITSLFYDQEDTRSLSENSIHSMFKDREGIIWIGTYKNGISYYHPNIFRFQMYKSQLSVSDSLPINDINALARDTVGNLWIGTNGGGLIYFDRKKNSFKQYMHDPTNSNSLTNNVIVSLLVDHENALWIGTYYGGLARFDGKRFRRFMHNASDPKSFGDDNAWNICEDSEHNLWIGTLKGGADVYNRNKDEFYHYKSGAVNSIHTTYVPTVMEDKDGNIWMGTGYGLEIFDKQSGRFTQYLNNPRDSTSVIDNSIISILQDARGLIWIGTHSGLSLYEPTTKTFRPFQQKDGLGDDFILALVEDDDHNIWISTQQGLSKVVITESSKDSTNSYRYTFSFSNYGESDGLWGGTFHANAALKCSTGELVFGGGHGFTIFQPTKINEDKTIAKVVFTDFHLFNRSVKIGEKINNDLVLPAAVSHLSEITLKPDNNIFSIEFAALNFFHPEKTKYKYKLEGFNKEWLTTEGTQNNVTFTNLNPGTYIFQVMASNSDGLWSEHSTSMRINVLPPFWKSNVAYLLYAIFIIGGLFLVRWLTITRLRMNLNIQHARLEAKRIHELDMMKIKFFTNVSHEFRTPLTLILTPLEKFISKATGDDAAQLQLIHRNARRLLNMVNQLLDFRKIEVQDLKLNPSEGDIIGFIKDLVYSFSDLSEKKNINLSFNTTIQHLETFFDQDKIEKILFNLLSNAFKFTLEGGDVRVELALKEKESNNYLEMKVVDTGIGIPAHKHQKIFDRFFQDELPESLINQGSGIGLAITWEFVKVHGGTIEVESEPGKGSCFTVLLPVTLLKSETVMNYRQNASLNEGEILELENNHGKPVLLLVEDNEDFRFYLKENLKTHYAILEAANGKAGFMKAMATIPDLVVCDIMMPAMNGLELCKNLRNDVHTSHIPIILLTARTSEEQKIEGFASGANDYITKPFSFEILQSRIKNLLVQREASQKKFQKHFDVKASDLEVTSLDEKFIKKAIELVELNITDPDFSVENLSHELGMSRGYLYQKLLSLTGKSPLEFMKTMRLQQAAQLLEKSQLNVSEVAYKVGFNNPKYFAKCFKEKYNMLPSAYAYSKKSTPDNS